MFQCLIKIYVKTSTLDEISLTLANAFSSTFFPLMHVYRVRLDRWFEINNSTGTKIKSQFLTTSLSLCIFLSHLSSLCFDFCPLSAELRPCYPTYSAPEGAPRAQKSTSFSCLTKRWPFSPGEGIKLNRTEPRDMVDLSIGGTFVAFLSVSNEQCLEICVDKFQATMKINQPKKTTGMFH